MMTITKEKFEEHTNRIAGLVKKYEIEPKTTDGKVTGFKLGKRPESDAEVREIIAEQYTIPAYFTDLYRAKREKKAAVIPGLSEIKKAQAELDEWNRKFNASFDSESGGGQGIGPMPKYDIEAMRKQYPIADAFLKAEDYWLKSNYELSVIGKRALDAIVENSEDYESIMVQMEKELKEFSNRHMWD